MLIYINNTKKVIINIFINRLLCAEIPKFICLNWGISILKYK